MNANQSHSRVQMGTNSAKILIICRDIFNIVFQPISTAVEYLSLNVEQRVSLEQHFPCTARVCILQDSGSGIDSGIHKQQSEGSLDPSTTLDGWRWRHGSLYSDP